MRIALTLAYNGTHFYGSQVQKETSATIFGTLETVFHRLGITQRVVASGRTDKGVHATGQVAHVDLPPFWNDLEKLHYVANKMLPDTIQIKTIKKVSNQFHARYSAQRRVYRYIIKSSQPNPFENDFITFLPQCNFEDLQKKITLFIGEHDFKNFIKTGSDEKSTQRIIYKAFAYKHHGMIILYFEANGFLRTQIRLMVGALLKLSIQQIEEKLACRINHAIKPAPPNGLYLAKIKYKNEKDKQDV